LLHQSVGELRDEKYDREPGQHIEQECSAIAEGAAHPRRELGEDDQVVEVDGVRAGAEPAREGVVERAPAPASGGLEEGVSVAVR